jgi:hypothetical protein
MYRLCGISEASARHQRGISEAIARKEQRESHIEAAADKGSNFFRAGFPPRPYISTVSFEPLLSLSFPPTLLLRSSAFLSRAIFCIPLTDLQVRQRERIRVHDSPRLSFCLLCAIASSNYYLPAYCNWLFVALCNLIPCPGTGVAAPKPSSSLRVRSTVPPFAPNRSGCHRKGRHPPRGEPRPPSSPPSLHSINHDPFLAP